MLKIHSDIPGFILHSLLPPRILVVGPETGPLGCSILQSTVRGVVHEQANHVMNVDQRLEGQHFITSIQRRQHNTAVSL